MEEDRNMYPLFIQINSPYCLRKLKSTNSRQVSAETGRMSSTMRVKVGQVGPQSGGSERLSHKDFNFLSYWAISQSGKTWTAGVNSAGLWKQTLVIRLLMSLKHKGLWPPAVTWEAVLCSLVSRGSWGSREPHTARGALVPPTASGQLTKKYWPLSEII